MIPAHLAELLAHPLAHDSCSPAGGLRPGPAGPLDGATAGPQPPRQQVQQRLASTRAKPRALRSTEPLPSLGRSQRVEAWHAADTRACSGR
jgi:hypothetical protein